MSEHTTAIERNIAPKIGARFFREGDAGAEVRFEFVIDPNNILGPRTATAADREAHPEAWARFEREVAPQAVPEAPPEPPVTAAEPPAAPKPYKAPKGRQKRAYTRRKAS